MSRDAYQPEYTFLCVAEAGVYAEAPNPWGDMPASVQIPDRRLSCYYGDVVEGGIILDKRPAFQRDAGACIHEAISGPMRKSTLPPGSFEGWDRKVIPIQQAIKIGGFDYVSLDVHVQRWRQLGARVGKRVGMTVQWEDGEIEPIRPEAERWKHDCK